MSLLSKMALRWGARWDSEKEIMDFTRMTRRPPVRRTSLLLAVMIAGCDRGEQLTAPTPVSTLQPNIVASATDLFISEYIEGSSNNKALEIFNGTGAPVDLAAGGYTVEMYFNGSTTATLTINLTGTVASGDVFVLAHSMADPAIRAQADQTAGGGWFNGNDAVVLSKETTFLDVVGQIGDDPATGEWGVGLTSTADNTLRRRAAVCQGDPNGSDPFEPAVEWDGYPNNTFDGLGSHSAVCVVVGQPATLLLDPPAAVNPVGARHCVTATVQDAAGNPVEGVTVRFAVGPSVPNTFPSPSSGTGTTDANGQARFCYTASLPGVDRIHAFADVNDDGMQGPPTEEPSGDAEKTWRLPVSTELCEVKITDGGWIIANNTDRASFGGNAKVLADGTVQGHQTYQDHGPVQPMNVNSTEITATTCSQDRTTASIFGEATIDGAGEHVFRIDVTDGGSGGSNDTYGITLQTTGYMSGQQPLGGGNITIHKN
jgi:lamin tail-like protein/Big-like domain-containing protein